MKSKKEVMEVLLYATYHVNKSIVDMVDCIMSRNRHEHIHM